MLSATDVRRKALSAGANAFLRKPQDVPALAETCARLISDSRRGTEPTRPAGNGDGNGDRNGDGHAHD